MVYFLRRLTRIYFTIRHLRAEQIVYRLYYRLARGLVRRRALISIPEISHRAWRQPWDAPRVAPRSDWGESNFEFLGLRGQVKTPADWNRPTMPKLWLYNLHYLDDLNATDAATRVEQQTGLIQAWINDNPPLTGNGWEPYPLSLRLVNLVKWCARSEAPLIHPSWLASFARQTQALSVQVERHILANHLFENGKALVFAGVFLAGEHANAWLRQGLAILDREVKEQFLPDGGHFELSPMYHASLLWDMCDLVNLANRCGLSEVVEPVAKWRRIISRGLGWLEIMCHPDGEIAFFNDAAIGIAPKPDDIWTYAEWLGCAPSGLESPAFQFKHLTSSGYISINLGQGGKAFMDVARVGPDYQPGHAHADTLSFELSLFEQRVIVNSGTSVYGTDEERYRQRSTSAHNTLTIDGVDSSEVWGGFRVGRRAYPKRVNVHEEDNLVVVEGCHDGYHYLSGKPMHCRKWEAGVDNLVIIDHISGEGTHNIVSSLHIHPDIKVHQIDEFGVSLILPQGHEAVVELEGFKAIDVMTTTYHPEFGMSMPTSVIRCFFSGSVPVTLQTKVSWKE